MSTCTTPTRPQGLCPRSLGRCLLCLVETFSRLTLFLGMAIPTIPTVPTIPTIPTVPGAPGTGRSPEPCYQPPCPELIRVLEPTWAEPRNGPREQLQPCPPTQELQGVPSSSFGLLSLTPRSSLELRPSGATVWEQGFDLGDVFNASAGIRLEQS